jgi:dGTPase
VERYCPEAPKRQDRTAFARDRARVVHSSAMRRLGAKTQVLTPGTDDYSRTRLTHSLEVAQIGREMGRALGADPDLVDTACLVHDLGHPPFGHNGETALAALATEIGGFEGNAQTLRVLSRLEPKVLSASTGLSAGLNLTRASLDASVKYPWTYADRPCNPDGSRTGKFGVYPDDEPIFTWLRAGAPEGKKPIEAQIMDLADDIAYSVHDVEDAIVSGRVDLGVLRSSAVMAEVIASTQEAYGSWVESNELEAAFDRLRSAGFLQSTYDNTRRGLSELKNRTSDLIGRFSAAALKATRTAYGSGTHTRFSAELVVPADTVMEIQALKGLAWHFVMAPREGEPMAARQREILTNLVGILSDRAPDELETQFAEDWHAARDDGARLRAVIDQVASLTDQSANAWHARFFGSAQR